MVSNAVGKISWHQWPGSGGGGQLGLLWVLHHCPSAAEPSGLWTLLTLSSCSPVMHKAQRGVGWSPGKPAARKELGYGSAPRTAKTFQSAQGKECRGALASPTLTIGPGMVAGIFNASTQEAKADGSL